MTLKRDVIGPMTRALMLSALIQLSELVVIIIIINDICELHVTAELLQITTITIGAYCCMVREAYYFIT